jgi:hypothetical protein
MSKAGACCVCVVACPDSVKQWRYLVRALVPGGAKCGVCVSIVTGVR